MNIIIPMAGMGKRMRPHTLVTPKPLLHVAGLPIVEHLVNDIAGVCKEKINSIGYIIGNFGTEVENRLIQCATHHAASGKVYIQHEALGTAHAILCAAELLEGPVVVAFADTLFKADFEINTQEESAIWVSEIEDPSAFGVVKLDQNGYISEFIEKPTTPVSNLAIIGVYYFKDGAALKKELQYLIDEDIKEKGEYQLTTALENLKQKGLKFYPKTVTEWWDCGNKEATVYTNERVLWHKHPTSYIAPTVTQENVTIHPPCYIADNVQLKNVVIGPYVTIGADTTIQDSAIQNSLIGHNNKIQNSTFTDSMIGNNTVIHCQNKVLNVGDYSSIQ